VIHAGAYPVKAGMTVMQAITIGGGITPRGSENRVKLRRLEADGKTREYDAKLVDVVRPDDVIFVKEALF
jgi:polysaccharide export outer membrane protein